MKGIDNLNYFLGKKVSKAWIGHGSFLIIDFISQFDNIKKEKLWIYLSDWAVFCNENEVIGSDNCFSGYLLEFMLNKKLLEYFVIDREEFHLIFENEICLMVWENNFAYGNNAEALIWYHSGRNGSIEY